MTYITNALCSKITSVSNSDNQQQGKMRIIGREIAERVPNYEAMEKPDQGSVHSEIDCYIVLGYSANDQKILASKPKDLDDADQVRRTNLSGSVRSFRSKLLRLAFPKDRGHGVKRNLSQYLIDTPKAVIKRCEAADRGEWGTGVKETYDHAKQALAAIK